MKGSGHNSAGKATCDDGIIIDLSLMCRVSVDRVKKTGLLMAVHFWMMLTTKHNCMDLRFPLVLYRTKAFEGVN